MKKKCLSKAAAATLILSMLLEACGTTDNSILNTESADNTESSSGMNDTISFGFWDISEMEKSSVPDALTVFLQERFGFTAEAISFNWTNYKENYQILCATDNQPDVFSTLTISSNQTNDSATYRDMIISGSIRALPDDLSAYPNLCALMEQAPYTRYEDGHSYAIPRLNFHDDILSCSDAAMIVRRDWMNHLGISDPQNIDDFIAMTAAFTHNDPDGNGIDDTLGYNVNNLNALGKWLMLGIAPECNVYSWTLNDDGIYAPSWLSEDFLDVVLAYRKLYESGGLDPDFYVKTPSAVIEDFASGRLGALEYKSSPGALEVLKNTWDQYNDLSFEECVDVLPIFPAQDGIRYCNSSTPFWSETYISSNVSDEKLDIILKLYDYLLSEEGRQLCKYGLEGEDYIYDENKNFTCLLDLKDTPLSGALSAKYPSYALWSVIAAWGCDMSEFEVTDESCLRYGEAPVRLANRDLQFNLANTVQVERPYSFMLYPKENSNINEQAFDQFILCIIGREDPLAMWDDAITDFHSARLSDYVKRQNDSYNAHLMQNQP